MTGVEDIRFVQTSELLDRVQGGLDSMLWLNNNLHNYALPLWRELFEKGIHDVERAKVALTELRNR